MKKLTLSMDEQDIEAAKRLAKERGTTVSQLVSRLIRAIARRNRADGAVHEQRARPPRVTDNNRRPDWEEELPPLTRKALGMIALPEGKSE